MVVKGKDLMLFKKAGETLVAWGAATNHTLSVNTEMQDSSNKDTGKWNTAQPGRYNWSMGSENMMVQTDYDDLLASMIDGAILHVVFEIAANANSDTGKPAEGWVPGAGGWEGDVYITSIETNAPHNDNATYTVAFTGSGPLVKRTTP